MDFSKKRLDLTWNESVKDFEHGRYSGYWPKFEWSMSRLLLLREWRDMDVSPGRRLDTLREAIVNDVSDEGTQLICAFF